MKRLMLVCAMFISVSTYSAQNYSSGNLLLGVGVGAGSPNIPLSSMQFTVHPSVELIVGTKNAWAFGVTVDSSVNFGNVFTASLAPMFTVHYTILPRWDIYTSLGLGLQLYPTDLGTSGRYNLLVGFNAGFNVIISPSWLWNIGVAIHSDQFFGSSGVKYRFGDASKIQYKK